MSAQLRDLVARALYPTKAYGLPAVCERHGLEPVDEDEAFSGKMQSGPAPRTTVQSPLRWSDDPSWKLDYSNVERLSDEEITRRRREFDEAKRVAKERRQEAGAT